MQLFTNHSFNYEAEQIGQLFFPVNDNTLIHSELFEQSGTVSVKTKINCDGKEADGFFMSECHEKRDYANCVKRSAFEAAKKLSDIPTPWGILTGIRPSKPVRDMILRGKSDNEIISVLKNTYLVSEKKASLALHIAKTEINLLSENQKDIAVYIGIPFCPTRCIYCSFISHDASRMIKLAPEYIQKLCDEISKTSEIIKSLGMNIRTLYFGGGTPTSLTPAQIDTLLRAAESSFDLSSCREYTYEAGRPDTITPEKLDVLKSHGVNRISINPQTCHNKTLELIGRRHTYEDFLNAFSLARSKDFSFINCDLIAGLPGEDETDFEKSVNSIIDLAPENVTVHTLYIKRASAIGRMFAKEYKTDTVFNMVELSSEKCVSSGYMPYYLYKQKTTLGNLENVGYAKKGFECLYNLDTMSDAMTVFALGAGGTTKLVRGSRIDRVFNFKNADEYIKRFDEIISRKESVPNYFI